MQKLKNFFVILFFCAFLLICAWIVESQSLNRKIGEGLLDLAPNLSPRKTASISSTPSEKTY